MKTTIISISTLFLSAYGLLLFGCNTGGNNGITGHGNPLAHHLLGNAEKGFAVVELFTSEGCSSCPPADALANKLIQEGRDEVYVLAYHVDYWDRLGWKDPFSKAAFTQRQQRYVANMQLNSAYTPQVVVNGTKELIGSNSKELYKAIDDASGGKASGEIKLSATVINNKITVRYELTDVSGAEIQLALVQSNATIDVKRGENSGRQLKHMNIVRDWISTTATKNGEASFATPDGFDAKGYKVIALLQNTNTLAITSAMQCDVQ